MPKERLGRLIDELRRAAKRKGAGRSGVDVAIRSNVVVQANVGRPGSRTSAASRQEAPIVQDGGERRE